MFVHYLKDHNEIPINIKKERKPWAEWSLSVILIILSASCIQSVSLPSWMHLYEVEIQNWAF